MEYMTPQMVELMYKAWLRSLTTQGSIAIYAQQGVLINSLPN